MLFLSHIFRVRGKVHGEEEKPFLEHLEELRVMITRVVITLVLSTLLCWVFHKTVVDVITKPVNEVWNSRQGEKLPEDIGIDEWEKIKRVHAAAMQLGPEQRESFYTSFEDEKMQLRAESSGFYRSALLIEDEEKRKQWVDQLPGTGEEQRQLIHALLEKKPAVEIGAKANVVSMKSLKPTETFMLAFKLAFFSGLVISFPLNLWFVLQFVLPGLRSNEKKIMWPAMVTGFGLFLAGVLFAYFLVLPRALDFFFTFGAGMGVENEWRIGYYASFVTQFTLIFGLAFELPVLVMSLVKLGLVGYQEMSNTRSYAIVGIVVIAAAITPTSDILTLCMLAVPMYLLYEMCIILAYFDHRKKAKAEAQEYARTGVRKEATVIPAAGALTVSTEEDDDLDDQEDFDELEDMDDLEEESFEEERAEVYAEEDLDDSGAEDETDGDEGDSDSYEENLSTQQEESLSADASTEKYGLADNITGENAFDEGGLRESDDEKNK